MQTRLNKFIASATGVSRRAADEIIAAQRVMVNGQPTHVGQSVVPTDVVTLDGKEIAQQQLQTVIFHKPPGYVCSRDGQGSQTIYDILPAELHHLKPVGRLDKDSSGLLLLTNDGALAQRLTHPSNHKIKLYEIALNKPLEPLHQQMISDFGVTLDDGVSKLSLESLNDRKTAWRVRMHEGRNRQIRRTFASLGYTVTSLHRTHFGDYALGSLARGAMQEVAPQAT